MNNTLPSFNTSNNIPPGFSTLSGFNTSNNMLPGFSTLSGFNTSNNIPPGFSTLSGFNTSNNMPPSFNTSNNMLQSFNNTPISSSEPTIDQSFIEPLPIHKRYGVIDIPGISVISIKPAQSGKKKYTITVEYNGIIKNISYGHKDYQQYEDRTPIKSFKYLDHHDDIRRASYLARSSKITNKSGLAANDPFSADRYAIITLW